MVRIFSQRFIAWLSLAEIWPLLSPDSLLERLSALQIGASKTGGLPLLSLPLLSGTPAPGLEVADLPPSQPFGSLQVSLMSAAKRQRLIPSLPPNDLPPTWSPLPISPQAVYPGMF